MLPATQEGVDPMSDERHDERKTAICAYDNGVAYTHKILDAFGLPTAMTHHRMRVRALVDFGILIGTGGDLSAQMAFALGESDALLVKATARESVPGNVCEWCRDGIKHMHKHMHAEHAAKGGKG